MAEGCALFNYSLNLQKSRKTFSSNNEQSCGFVILFPHSNLSTVVEHKGYLAVPVDDCFFDHHRPYSIVPFLQHCRLFFESTNVKSHRLVLLTVGSPQFLKSPQSSQTSFAEKMLFPLYALPSAFRLANSACT